MDLTSFECTIEAFLAAFYKLSAASSTSAYASSYSRERSTSVANDPFTDNVPRRAQITKMFYVFILLLYFYLSFIYIFLTKYQSFGARVGNDWS